MKHLPIGIIYGFISLISFMGTEYVTVDILTIGMLISWIFLLMLILNIQWFDKTTDGYFIFTILLFMAARMAKYNAPEIAVDSTMIAIGVGLGLVANCCVKGHVKPALCLLAIFGIEIGDILLLKSYNNDSVNLEDIFPNDFYPLNW